MNIEIRVLTTNDWELYRTLRLNSLIDSPSSFGSSYEAEVNYPKEKWYSLINAANSCCMSCSLPLVAVMDNEPVGIGLGFVHDLETKIGYIYQMWIKPNGRRKGLGRKLIQSIIIWVKSLQLNSLSLSVTNANSFAIPLYLSCGFKPIGRSESACLVFTLKL